MSFKSIIAGLFGRQSRGMEISYSKINAYLYCPMKYKLLYEEGKFVQPTPAISLGQSIHRALEDFHSHKYDGADELIECYDRVWVNTGFSTPQQALDFYNKGYRMLRNYWEAARDMKSEIIYVEKDFSFDLGKHRVRGLIDRVDKYPDGTYELMDYKTHNEMWPQDRVDSDLQLSIYALGCKECFGFEPDQLSIYFIAHGRKMYSSRSREQIEAAKKTITEVADKIVKKDFEPKNPTCKNCDMKHHCPKNAKNKN